jgi:hypothetical protein
LRDVLSRVDDLTAQLGEITRRLDPQIAGFEELGWELRALNKGAEACADRLRREHSALGEAVSIYDAAERIALRASEELPSSIAERGLVFESWFTELLR